MRVSADSGYGYCFLPVAGADFSTRVRVYEVDIRADFTRCHLYVLLEDVEEWALGVGREHVQARLGDIGAGRGGSGVRAEVEREARVWVAP